MIVLGNILSAIKIKAQHGADPNAMPMDGITADSRAVQQNMLFVAVKGTASDGHDYIPAAIEKGAVAIIAETDFEAPAHVARILVSNSAEALGCIAHAFYGYPSHHLQLIGITGTNGKTTTTTLCFNTLRALGVQAGLISTIENRIVDTIIPSTHTTPDPVQLNMLLARMVENGCTHVCMEVSSHAVHQRRISGLKYSIAAFTNITHDHLDYHGTFDAYIAAKKLFFDTLPQSAIALVNADDRRSAVMLQNCKAQQYTFSVKGDADFTARIRENLITGLVMQLDGVEFHAHLPGEFNAWNILCVYAICRLSGYEKETVLTALSAQTPVEGRFDVVHDGHSQVTGVVDYAHTPDAVEKILSTIRSMLTKRAKLITVVGCGGDRDRAKRPVMAAVAAEWSDRVILTSDNPRSEDPESILREMEAGLQMDNRSKCISITDRREAIRTAVMLAGSGDVVCVAGKGHEKYQEIRGVKYPFDDKQVLQETFQTKTY